jgi:cytochrome oxidase Cu insertion factor (SCO1/SenC/PrrC family)
MRRSTIWLVALVVVGGFAFATVFAYGLSKLSAKPAAAQMPRPSGIPAGVSTSLAYLMQLSTVPTRTAPNFTLTDQNNHRVSLAGLRGKTVVLTFMDPHCTDICPLVSREFLDARRDLGAAGRNVVFVAVNVNQYHGGVAAMASYTRRMRLDTMPSWHFVTGALPALRKVWKEYQIYVDAPSPTADVIHTSLIYFIDPKGQERYVVAPMADHTKKGMAYLPPGQLDKWGHGIALMARAVSG